MDERLAFGYGSSGNKGATSARSSGPDEGPRPDSRKPAEPSLEEPPRTRRSAAVTDDKPDVAFMGLMVFTAMLFFRPQDTIRALGHLHLAELSAVGALIAMVTGRISRGLTFSRLTPELGGVVLMGGIILFTVPFSVWPGGSLGMFTEIYSKIILIFILIVNTLTSRKRVEQFVWLMVIASGYIALRAVIDAGRGINMVENGRVQGAVGGMFKNPNDLALNMVAVMPLAASLALRSLTLLRRAGALLCVVLMLGAIVASQSRSGTIGLLVMVMVLGVQMVRRTPMVAFAGVLAVLLALPLVPGAYWHRLSSITDESADDTGSRAARQTLLRESFTAFLQHPLTGVGAGQFKNYDPEHREQPWRESHDVVLQVAAELGIAGLATLFFLIGRAAMSGFQVQRLLRRAGGLAGRGGRLSAGAVPAVITPDDAEWFQWHSAAMMAALAGWFFCALFASVAYNWTFYYLLALATAPREILIDRLASRRPSRRPEQAVTLQEVRA
jgi:putative inorganic carbon (HCO3(-)) transporter